MSICTCVHTEGPSSKEECEVILMVGLPSAGKTSWVQKQMRKNREKRYTVLGTNYILNKMRVGWSKGGGGVDLFWCLSVVSVYY